MPILFAIVGSLLLSQTRELGILGGIAGFAGGWLISMGISRYCVIAKQ
ncbi:MAG: hypothetical protein MI748_01990 [Opitutales bacterium]|nr:hypothetical protein [Opitutales bacterium]